MYDIKAKITSENKRGIWSGYRPAYDINGYLTTGMIEFIDTKRLDIGETAEAYITFISPEYYSQSLCVGQKIDFYDGSKKVGEAQVLEIYNKILERK